MTKHISVEEFRTATAPVKRTNKFNARKTEVDGILFDSKAEAERFGTLKLLERAKQVRGVAVQPRFDLKINGILIGHYTADFIYFQNGRRIVEDVKGGPLRPADSLRMRVFMACFVDHELRIVDGQGRSKPFKQRQAKSHELAA